MDQALLSGRPVVGVPQLLGHVRNMIVVVDDVRLVPILRPVLPTVPVGLLLVRVLLYLRHGVDPPVVEGFEVSSAGEVVGGEVDPGRESVVRVVRLRLRERLVRLVLGDVCREGVEGRGVVLELGWVSQVTSAGS